MAAIRQVLLRVIVTAVTASCICACKERVVYVCGPDAASAGEKKSAGRMEEPLRARREGGEPEEHEDAPECTGALSGVAAISSGDEHTCALLGTGGVKCWGSNMHGQLGSGTTDNAFFPVFVSGLETGAAAVTAGLGHTCALLETGSVKCWGMNDFGQLGDGTKTGSRLPVNVRGLGERVTAIAAGSRHTCALLESGGVKCWGCNVHGQIGSGSGREAAAGPVYAAKIKRLGAAVAAGDAYSCVLMKNRALKCWGSMLSKLPGPGPSTKKAYAWVRRTPVHVPGLSRGVAAVAVGQDHACALLKTGGVKCWGSQRQGQLAEGSISHSLVPVGIPGLEAGAAAVAAHDHYTCALLKKGRVVCWGANTGGVFGDETKKTSMIPVEIHGLGGDVSAVSAGGDHACALSAQGGVECWGSNDQGQLGDGTNEKSLSPVKVLERPGP